MTHAERCAIAQQCVPPSAFRAQLTALHDEMLAAVAAERERCARLCDIVAGCCADRLESRAATRCAGAIRGLNAELNGAGTASV